MPLAPLAAALPVPSPTALPLAVVPPETVPLSAAQHSLVQYAVVVAGLALLASFLHTWHGLHEVGPRYRPASYAHLAITAVAFLSYVLVLVHLTRGYTPVDGVYEPDADALYSISTRYMDWSVTVPLLVVELLAVSTLVGARRTKARVVAMTAAFAMILTGYLGTQTFDSGGDASWLWTWWAVSSGFFLLMYAVLVPAVVASVRALPCEVGRTYAAAAVLLGTTFLVYPVVYLVPVFASGGAWTTTMQVAFSAADVVAKVGFGVLVHEVAKRRTALDVLAGEDVHPESVWVVGEHLSPAILPPVRAHRPGSPAGRVDPGGT